MINCLAVVADQEQFNDDPYNDIKEELEGHDKINLEEYRFKDYELFEKSVKNVDVILFFCSSNLQSCIDHKKAVALRFGKSEFSLDGACLLTCLAKPGAMRKVMTVSIDGSSEPEFFSGKLNDSQRISAPEVTESFLNKLIAKIEAFPRRV